MSDYKFGDVIEFTGSIGANKLGLPFRHRQELIILDKLDDKNYRCLGYGLLGNKTIAKVPSSRLSNEIKKNLLDEGSLIFKYLKEVEG